MLIMRRTLGLAVLVWLAAVAHAQPQQVVLDNGLTVVVEEDHSAPVATVQFFVGTGSIMEGEYLGSGLSHLLEHVISDGSATRTQQQIDDDRARLGNNSNAYTSTDTVSYYVITSGAQTTAAMDHLADYIFHPTFPEEAVKTQQGIITREMARGEDETSRELYYMFAGLMFRVSPAGQKVIGHLDQFKALTRDDVVKLHRRYYVPGNIVLTVVGDFDAKQLLAHIGKTLGPLPPRAVPRAIIPSEPPQLAPRRVERRRDDVARAYFMMGVPTVSLFSPDMYPLDVASYILTNGDASRLVAKLRDEQGLVDAIRSGSSTPAYDAGSFVISGVTTPDKMPQVEAAVLAELARLQREPVSKAELDRAKRQKEADLLFSRTTTQGRAETYGSNLLTTGDLHFGERYLDGIRQVTAADIQRAARKYFIPTHVNFALLAPPSKEGPHTPEAPSAAGVSGPGPDAGGTAAAIRPLPGATAGTIHEATLANGLRLLVQENHAVPVVNLFVAAPGGLRYETEKNVGLTSLMAQMLVRGTKTRTRLQIAQALENVGASLAPYSGRNSFGILAQVRTQDLPLAMNIAAEALLHPSFPEAELQQQRQLQLASLAMREDDVDTVAGDLLRQELFRQHPYRFPTGGTPESVQKLTRPDLMAFHAALTRPASMVLAVFGDVTLSAAKSLAEKTFGKMPAGAVALQPAADEPAPDAPRLKTVTRPQQQAILMTAFRTGTLHSPDRFAEDVMNAIFAGVGYPGGRLHNTLRNAQLVYATSASGVAGPEVGYFVIYAGTAPDKVGVVQEQIAKIVHDLQTQPPTADELALGKTVAIAAHAVGLESSGARAQAVALDVLYGLGSGELFRYAEEINKVTAAQVQEQARKVLDWPHRVEIITTPPAEQP